VGEGGEEDGTKDLWADGHSYGGYKEWVKGTDATKVMSRERCFLCFIGLNKDLCRCLSLSLALSRSLSRSVSVADSFTSSSTLCSASTKPAPISGHSSFAPSMKTQETVSTGMSSVTSERRLVIEADLSRAWSDVGGSRSSTANIFS